MGAYKRGDAWGMDNGIWLVSFMDYDLGYIDLEEKTLQPLDNPFGPKRDLCLRNEVLPMCPVRTVMSNGPCRIRTYDQGIMSPLL